MNFHTNGDGYSCENYDEEFKERIKMASKESFNKNPLYYAEGGSIPVVNIFSKLFPKSRIMVTGVLGPNSNAHGPDENIDISSPIIQNNRTREPPVARRNPFQSPVPFDRSLAGRFPRAGFLSNLETNQSSTIPSIQRRRRIMHDFYQTIHSIQNPFLNRNRTSSNIERNNQDHKTSKAP